MVVEMRLFDRLYRVKAGQERNKLKLCRLALLCRSASASGSLGSDLQREQHVLA